MNPQPQPALRPDSRSIRRVRVAVFLVLVLFTALISVAIQGHDTGNSPSVLGQLAPLFRQPLLLCFVSITAGLAVGLIRIGGISVGSSGVLFVALLLGHLGSPRGWTIPEGVGTLGLVLFVYAVGLSAGPTFFRVFRDEGKLLALLAAAVVSCGGFLTIVLARLCGLPLDFAAGLFAGSMTSTPALAAGLEAAVGQGADPDAVSIGYGMAYPIGVIATVLFVQLLPRLLKVNLDDLGKTLVSPSSSRPTIDRFLIEIANPAVVGQTLHELVAMQDSQVQVTRIRDQGQMVPIRFDRRLELGDVLLVVAERHRAKMIELMLGRRLDELPRIVDEGDRAEVVVTNPAILGQPLRDLHLRGKYGVTISRIERYGVSFVPTAATSLSMADRLTAVGPREGLAEFLKAAGHRVRKLHETDFLSLAAGLSVGIIVGLIPIAVPGLGSISLGMAGGPLLVGLLLSHFGRFLGVVGYMPLASRMLMQELGLFLFLVAAGFDAGGDFVSTIRSLGFSPFVIAVCVPVASMLMALGLSRYVFRIDLLRTLGGTCGAMTSTAALGVLSSETDSEIPLTSYAAAYPAALVLMTICAQLVVMAARS